MGEKIQMHLEVTDGLQNEQSSEFYISGPVKIFATVDDLSTDFNQDKCGLYSKEFMDIVRESDEYKSGESIIVFVENLFNTTAEDYPKQDSLKYRGSYFALNRDIKVNEGQCDEFSKEQWQEILIGTHTHENKEVLDNISSLNFENIKDEQYIRVVPTSFGSYEFKLTKADPGVPELPGWLIDEISDNKKTYQRDPDSTENHLDGVHLYGIEEPDISAQCNDIYDYLRYKNQFIGVKLIDSEFKLIQNDGQKLEIYEKHNLSDICQQDPIKENYSVFIFSDIRFINSLPLIYIDNSPVSPLDYTITKTSDSVLQLSIKKDVLLDKSILNLITLEPGTVSINDFNSALQENKILIDDIKTEIYKLYSEIALNHEKEVPRVYLTNDNDGKLVWENTLLPTQTFYANTKLVDENITVEDNSIRLTFADVNFEIGVDFPIILVDELFAFDQKHFVVGKNNEDLEVVIPKDYFNFSNNGKKVKVTLLCIKNTSASTLQRDIFNNYVTKEDAIRILTHGKVELDDYAKKDDLTYKADINHVHSQYAKRWHTHDYRYADYHHTHAEYVTKQMLMSAINQCLDKPLNEDEIKDLITENIINQVLAGFNTNKQFMTADEVKKIFKDAGFLIDDTLSDPTFLSDGVLINTNLTTNDKISENLLKKLLRPDKDGNLEDISVLDQMNLTDFVERILLLFDRDTVDDNQVLLSKDIPIHITTPIGGIDGQKKIYKAGTDLREILTDMLNPFRPPEEIARELIPVKAVYNFYQDQNFINPVDIEKLPYILYDQKIYVKFDKFLNEFGKDCVYIYDNSDNTSIEMTATQMRVEFAYIPDGYEANDYLNTPGSIKYDRTFTLGDENSENPYFIFENSSGYDEYAVRITVAYGDQKIYMDSYLNIYDNPYVIESSGVGDIHTGICTTADYGYAVTRDITNYYLNKVYNSASTIVTIPEGTSYLVVAVDKNSKYKVMYDDKTDVSEVFKLLPHEYCTEDDEFIIAEYDYFYYKMIDNRHAFNIKITK